MMAVDIPPSLSLAIAATEGTLDGMRNVSDLTGYGSAN
jgi:hypothetical protein